MKKKDQVDKIISNVIYEFTHLWVMGFGWENTVFLASDFDKVLKMPIVDRIDGKQLFMAYEYSETLKKYKTYKFKGHYHGRG